MTEPAGKDQIFIRYLTEIIIANLGNENFGVRELAHESGISQYTISRRLDSTTGKTTNQFIRETRFHRALEMLQNEEVPVSEVAYKVGFSNPAYFNSCFTDFFGFPPDKVKKSGRGNNHVIIPTHVAVKQELKRGFRKTFIIIASFLLPVAFIAFMVFNIFIKNSSSDNVSTIKNIGESSTDNQAHNDTVKDSDGNVYPIITIGTQVWIGKDLETTKYNDGTPITRVNDDKEMANVKSGAYLWTKANKSDKTVYGALYNWSAIGDKLCPAGWHVATYKDWETLVNYCGGWEIAGGKLKETGTAHWDAPNIGATNNFGFTALPTWEHGSSDGYWCPPRFGYLISMGSDRTWIYLTECHDCVANSVRCVKD